MWLKLIVLIVVAGLIYRMFGGKIPFIDKMPEKKDEDAFGQIESTSECASCGTYMTEADALIYHKKAYCSNDCVEKSKKLK